MYAGHVTCYSLVSHVEYAPCTLLRLGKDAVLRLEKKWDRGTDGRQTVKLRLPLNAASVMSCILVGGKYM